MKHWKLIFAFLACIFGLQAVAQEQSHLPQMTLDEVKQYTLDHPSSLAVVLVSAKWCLACHRIEPFYVKAAELMKDEPVLVVKIDFDEHKEWAASLGIHSIPQTEFFYQGTHRWKYTAGLSDVQLVKESRLALEAAQKGTFTIESYSVLQSVR